MRFGAHVSIADGLAEAVGYATSVGCECMQIFAKSPRQWESRQLHSDDVTRFREVIREQSMGPVFTHTAYLLNLSTTDDVLRQRSALALADELRRGALLGVEGVVTHIGTDPEGDPGAAASRASDSIRRAFEAACATCAAPPRLLLENTAGAGTTFGGSMGDVCRIAETAKRDGLPCGLCLDTCHAHAFGYDVVTGDGWDSLLAEIGVTCGIDALGAIHANDCVAARGDRRDRHAWVGDGEIGYAGFAAMIDRSALRSVCVITEMPGEIPYKDVENIHRLKALRQAAQGR